MIRARYFDKHSSSFEYAESIISISKDPSNKQSVCSHYTHGSEKSDKSETIEEIFRSITLEAQSLKKMNSKQFSERTQGRETCFKCEVF